MIENLLISAMLLATLLIAPPDRAASELFVMSFNIRNGRANDGEDSWPHRRERLFALLREQNADVIGLQEAFRDQVDAIRAALPGGSGPSAYDEAGVGRDDGKSAGEHSTLLFRSDRFRLEAQGTFWFSDTPETPGSRHWGNTIPRICTWARLAEKASGRTFTVFNLHLDHQSQPSRERSARLLLERLRGTMGPRIVMGDFNAGEQNRAIRALLDSSDPALVDTFRARHPQETAVSTFHGFKGGTQGAKIDYIFVTGELETTEARILRDHKEGRYPSDHYPVTARVRWRAAMNE